AAGVAVLTAVGRVAGLPLVSSAYEMASANYVATKETYPAIKAVCEVAETGVKAITSAAIVGARPILDQLEPQLAAANEYACRGLDRLEEQLPILQQPIEKVTILPCGVQQMPNVFLVWHTSNNRLNGMAYLTVLAYLHHCCQLTPLFPPSS
uniref:Perilipin-3-like n=1 Tax=Terrapene triunguis TaxID=2587831 RepID=A0A674JSV8_9SAUR